MPIKHLSSIDLNGNELQNSNLQNLATAPSSPTTGRIYYDTALGYPRYFDGTSWQRVGGAQGALNYQGTWNASTNTPTLTSGTGTKGAYYVVATAGATTLDGHSSWAVGDWAVYDGTKWDYVDNYHPTGSYTSKFAANVGALTAGTPLAIAHGLGTADLHVMLIEIATGNVVLMDTKVDATNITLTSPTSAGTGTYRVIAVG